MSPIPAITTLEAFGHLLFPKPVRPERHRPLEGARKAEQPAPQDSQTWRSVSAFSRTGYLRVLPVDRLARSVTRGRQLMESGVLEESARDEPQQIYSEIRVPSIEGEEMFLRHRQ